LGDVEGNGPSQMKGEDMTDRIRVDISPAYSPEMFYFVAGNVTATLDAIACKDAIREALGLGHYVVWNGGCGMTAGDVALALGY